MNTLKTITFVLLTAVSFRVFSETSARIDIQAVKTDLKPVSGVMTAKNAKWAGADVSRRMLTITMPEQKKI